MAAVETLQRRGLTIDAKDGNLIVSPRDRITDEIRAYIRQHKAAILEELRREALAESFEERAAILEFDANIPRREAEEAAFRLVFCSACQHHRVPDPHRPHLLGCAIFARGRALIQWASTPAWCDQWETKKPAGEGGL
jgi:hypothetical protein